MKEEEYIKKIKDLKREYEILENLIHKEFALSNAVFKIGDTIKDERWAFKIDKITVSKYGYYPQVVYHGFQLKKDLTPRKDETRVCIYGNNAIKI